VSATSDRLRTLVLARTYSHTVSYYNSWQNGLLQHPLYATTVQDVGRCRASALGRALANYDAVVLLHSCTADTLDDLGGLGPALADRGSCRLLAFVGNEFNSPHAPLAGKISALRACRPDIVATQLLEEAGRFLYAGVAPKIVSMPHALEEGRFSPGPADESRSIDLGFRGFRYSPLIGDQERISVVEQASAQAVKRGLKLDIDWDQRLKPEMWARFLQICRGTISCEAGSWYLDRDDALVNRIYDGVKRTRKGIVLSEDTPLRGAFRKLPAGLKKMAGLILRRGPVKYAAFEDESLDFQQLEQAFFKSAAKAPIYSKCISSRHFEAAGTRTCQVMIDGRYNDILRAGEHFIAVRPDFSNVEQAVEQFCDPTHRKKIADQAFALVRGAHTFGCRLSALHRVLAET